MLWIVELFSNSSNSNGMNEARRIFAVAMKKASLVPDVYQATIDFEITHGNNLMNSLFSIKVSLRVNRFQN